MRITSEFEAHGASFNELSKLLNDRTLTMKQDTIKPEDLEFWLRCDNRNFEGVDYDKEVLFYKITQESLDNFLNKNKFFDIIKVGKIALGEEEGLRELDKTGMIIVFMKERYFLSPTALSILGNIVGFHNAVKENNDFLRNLYIIKLFYATDRYYWLLNKSEVYVDKVGHQHLFQKIFSIAESQYVFTKELFKQVIDHCINELGLTIKDWNYTNEEHRVAFKLPKIDNIQPLLVILDSDCKHAGFTMRIEYHIGKTYMIGNEIIYRHAKGVYNKPFIDDIANLIADSDNLANTLNSLADIEVADRIEADTLINAGIKKFIDPKITKVFNKPTTYIKSGFNTLPGNCTGKYIAINMIQHICSMDKNEIDMRIIRRSVRKIPDAIKEAAV